MLNNNLTLSERMKEYERQSTCVRILDVNKPIIIRVDGNNFKRFTKGFQKPFDEVFRKAMYLTMLDLCKDIQNCVMGYTQSDEITLVLFNNGKDGDGWYGCKRDKMISLSAALTTKYFNIHFSKLVNNYFNNLIHLTHEDNLLKDRYMTSINSFAIFDSRAFNVPTIEEAINNLIYRQQDCIRNSINMVGRTYFSHKELKNKNTNDIIVKLETEKVIRLDDFATCYRYGCVAQKVTKEYTCSYINDETFKRNKWEVDLEIPIFLENKDYILNIINNYPIDMNKKINKVRK